MTRAIVATDRAHARRLARLMDDAEGLPLRGRPLTPGRTTISAEPGPGWTTSVTETVEHPVDGRLALLVSDELFESLQDSERLPTNERDELNTAVRARIELEPDWFESRQGEQTLRRVTLDSR